MQQRPWRQQRLLDEAQFKVRVAEAARLLYIGHKKRKVVPSLPGSKWLEYVCVFAMFIFAAASSQWLSTNSRCRAGAVWWCLQHTVLAALGALPKMLLLLWCCAAAGRVQGLGHQ
jgi:hypothetical protein